MLNIYFLFSFHSLFRIGLVVIAAASEASTQKLNQAKFGLKRKLVTHKADNAKETNSVNLECSQLKNRGKTTRLSA